MPKLKNPKHELLAQNVVRHNFNLTEAYQSTYPHVKHDSARAAVHRPLADISVRNRIDEIANEKGLTLEFEVGKLLETHSASKPVVVNGKIVDYPDHAVRLQAIQTGFKLHGYLQQGGGDTFNVDNRSVNISLTDESVNRLDTIVEKMAKLRAASAPTT